MAVKFNSSGGGSVTLDAPSTASNLTVTLPSASGTLVSTGSPFSGGTANGVVYLNGSSVPTAGSALTFDGTAFGVGTSSPSSYGQLAVYRSSGDVEAAVVTGGANYATYRVQNSTQRYSMQIRTDLSNSWAVRNETAGTNSYIIDTSGNSIWQPGGTEGMRLTSTGLGIGTSSPSARLSLGSTLDSSQSNITNHLALYSTTYGFGVTAGQLNYNSNGSHVFIAAGTEFMRLDASGNLGIGTSSPSAPLQVAKNANPLVVLNRSVATGDAGITMQSDGTNVAKLTGAYGGSLLFHTGSSDTERMRIDSSGNLLVGTTSTIAGEKLNVTGSVADNLVRFYNSNASPYGPLIKYTGANPNGSSNQFLSCYDAAARLLINSNGGIANYQANNSNLSDLREKTDFAPAKNYLDVICDIPVQTFKYIDQTDDDLTLGVVAQDVQAVAPELVSESNWGTEEEPKMRLSIYQTDLQYALMKCIQELKAELDATKAEVAALKGAK